MDNKDQPAFPPSKEMCEMPNGTINIEEYPFGLTKREYFAAKAMQGLLSIYDNGQVVPNHENVIYMAKLSVSAADQLLLALNEPKTPGV